MNILGQPAIHPGLFYSGKISGYFTWVILLAGVTGIQLVECHNFSWNRPVSVVLLISGLIFIVLSSIYLGKSTRLGLPSEETDLKTAGIYRYSRNPMYLGFNLITLSSALFSMNMIILVPGLYSIVIYHFIILGEERFLSKRFGREYLDYKEKVRRYL